MKIKIASFVLAATLPLLAMAQTSGSAGSSTGATGGSGSSTGTGNGATTTTGAGSSMGTGMTHGGTASTNASGAVTPVHPDTTTGATR